MEHVHLNCRELVIDPFVLALASSAEHTRLDYRELNVELAKSKFALAIASKWWEYSPWLS
jgi:hypothetical protein